MIIMTCPKSHLVDPESKQEVCVSHTGGVMWVFCKKCGDWYSVSDLKLAFFPKGKGEAERSVDNGET